MKLLVTGGAGYIGSVVAGHLLAAGHQVTVLDSLVTGHRDAVPEGADFVELDITESARVLTRTSGFDGVLHFAARSLVGESINNPELYRHNNVGGTRALLDAVRQAGVSRFVFSSTAATYGEPVDIPLRETAPTRPSSAYGSSKLAVDMMLTDDVRAYDLAAVSLRYFNVAGAWRNLGERHRPETHLIPIALEVAGGQRPSVSLHGEDYPTPDGTCVRDYIHVADVAEAHLLALAAPTAGQHRIYNLGSGRGYSVREVIDAVARVTARDVSIRSAPRRAGDPAVLIASNALINQELGWAPARTLDRMVSDAWNFAQATL